jgi:hypothetical protein
MTHSKPESHLDREEDKPLVTFIQRHASPVPEAGIHAEDRLMGAISSSIVQSNKKRWWQKRTGLMIVTGCSLLTYAAWQINQILIAPNPATVELAELEQFWTKDLDNLTATDRAKSLPEWDWVWSDDSSMAHLPSRLISKYPSHSQPLE